MAARGRQLRSVGRTVALLIPLMAIIWLTAAAAAEPKGTWDRSSTVGSFEVESVRGEVTVRFRSDVHGLDAGYFLYRLEEPAGTPVAVNQEMLPVPPTPGGVILEVVDRYAKINGSLTYAVVAVGVDGVERTFGPFSARRAGEPGRTPIARDSVGGLHDERGASDVAGPRSRSRRQKKGERGGGARVNLRVEVSEKGLYHLSADEIAAATGVSNKGIRRKIRRGRLQLETGGESVAWLPARKGKGLYFVGDTPGNSYSRNSVYWLGSGQGRLMERTDGGAPTPGSTTSGPETERFEVDEMPVTVAGHGSPDDFYYWSYIAAGHPVYGTAVHEFEIDERAVFAGQAVLELDLQGVTSTPASPEHRADVQLNGTLIGSAVWDGALPHRASIELPASLLIEGTNELLVGGARLPGVPYSAFLVDGFDLTFERQHRAFDGTALHLAAGALGAQTVTGFGGEDVIVLDVSDRAATRLVSNCGLAEGPNGRSVSFVAETPGAKYLVTERSRALASAAISQVDASLLVDEAQGGGYLVITPSALRDGAEALAEYRSGEGLSVYVAELEDVYDAFGAGLPSPHAIKAFVTHAYETWPAGPRFVTLIGSGTFDYRDAEGLGGNLLPPFMASTPYGYYSWDGFYADVAGDDLVPEVAIGRIPARTLDELMGYVDKLRRFEHLGRGVGPDDLLLLADNPDAGGNYPVDSDALQPLVPDWASMQRIYLSEQWLGQARANLIATLESGAAWVNYVGHGGIDRFAAEGLLTAQDVRSVPVNGRLPAVSAMTCSVGRFEVPGWTSLASEMVLAPDGGAGAVFAPSGQSLSFEAKIINRALFEALYAMDAETVGEAAVQALRTYSDEGRFDFMMQIYNVLGDPAYRIR